MTNTPSRHFEPWDSQAELTEEDLREIGRVAARQLRAILWQKEAKRRSLAKNADEPEG
jgi:hypothetical protein